MHDWSWGLTFMIFYNHGIQAFIMTTRLENHNFVVSLVWLFQYPKSSGCFLRLVVNPSRWEWIGKYQCLMLIRLTMKSIICSNVCSIISLLACKVDNFNFVGCTTSAPDGSSPRGYSQKILGIGSKVLAPCFVFLCHDLHKQFLKSFPFSFLFIECATNALDGSSPRGYGQDPWRWT
jgi:hypothetical protein